MSNTKKRKTKNIICSIVLCFGMLLSALTGLVFISNTEAKAESGYLIKDVSSDLLSSYYNFYTSSSAKPASANGWTELKDNAVNIDNIVRGVVDLTSETTFSTSTYHTTKPNMPKDKDGDKSYFKNLMINSYNGAGRFGYKSNSISLEENSFYAISVKLYTHRTTASDTIDETDPHASIYLTGLSDDNKYKDLVKFENINTLTSWETYTFYVDTDTSKNINLELWLGSQNSNVQGAVFFNYVQIQRFSEDYYIEKILNNSETKDNVHIISLSQSYTQPINNSSFETTSPMNWNKIAQSTSSGVQSCEIVDVNNFKLTTDNITINAPGTNYSANNEQALFLYNSEDGYQAIESSKITINPREYYKISFWTKSNCSTGTGATALLVDKSTSKAIDSAKLTISTSYTNGSNTYRNDWTRYTFYVYGDEKIAKEVSIQLWLGTKDTKTSGYVFIDDFRMQNIDYLTYSNNSSSTNSASLNFNNDKDLFTIVNSNFDKTSNSDNVNTYPLTPTSWTKSGNTNNNTFSGVVNTNKEHFESNINNYSNTSRLPVRPSNSIDDNNNVLMIGSTSESNSQTYTSENFSLSANNYYKLSFNVFTDYDQNSSYATNIGARVKLSSTTKTIYDYYNIHFTDNHWHQFVVFIKTGKTSETVNLAFMFEKLCGYVYFDDIRLETSNETVFNSFTQNPNTNYTKIDLSFENFDNKTFNKIEKIQTPNNWIGSESDSLNVTKTGIMSATDETFDDIASSPSGNKKLLYIQSLHDVNYTYTSKDSYTFTAQTYYKLSVNVLTKNIIRETIDENSDILVSGATIGLTNSSDMHFINIDTKGEWKTYTIYLYLENDLSTPISLGLGSKTIKTSGEALFDNLLIETIDKDTFAEEIKTTDDKTTLSFINYTETEDDTEESEPWTNTFNWLILPSLFTGLAIVIAIIGFYIRKITINKKPKIKTKYDRRKTLDKDIDRREKIALRQQIIDELNSELNAIDQEIEEYNILASKQLETIKEQIATEKEAIERQKLELEIKKKEAIAKREKDLKENPDLVSNTKAENEFNKLLTKLDKQEMAFQKELNKKDIKISSAQELDKSKLAKFLERKEFIKNEIAKIETEIEEIAKEESTMWEEYKQAKLLAKSKKAEYKAQIKSEKTEKKTTKKKTDVKTTKKEAIETNHKTNASKKESINKSNKD